MTKQWALHVVHPMEEEVDEVIPDCDDQVVENHRKIGLWDTVIDRDDLIVFIKNQASWGLEFRIFVLIEPS